MNMIKQSSPGLELDKQVNIAVRSILLAGARAEHEDLADLVLSRSRINGVPLGVNCVEHAHRPRLYHRIDRVRNDTIYGVAEYGGVFVLPFDDEWQLQLHMQHVPSQRQASPQQALQH